jgi:Fuc2NAc and GlcNAc transferase
MVAAALVAFGFWIYWAAGDWSVHKWLSCSVLFAAAMAILGFCDDVYSLSALFRFMVQFVFAFILLWAVSGLLPAFAIEGWAIPRVVWVTVGATWIVWMVNLYNFMDGIDGLAGGEAAVASCFFFLVFAYYGEAGWAAANLFIAAASMGFLIHNWHPARVFMGDAGSAFLGAFYGVQSVVAALSTPVPFPILVLPFANFILDTTYTLFRRMIGGEKWYQAHRSHFYQLMTNSGMSHAEVTAVELVSAVFSCAAANWYIRSGFTGRVVVLAVVIVAFVAGGVWVSRREGVIAS